MIHQDVSVCEIIPTLLTSGVFVSLQTAADSYSRVAFDVLVALVCVVSLVLCGRSILRGIVLQQVRAMRGGEL